MSAFYRLLAIATVIALGLAFSPGVSAHHKDDHRDLPPGLTGEPPPGCNASPEVSTPKKCGENILYRPKSHGNPKSHAYWHTTACKALNQGKLLEIQYGGYVQVVEVHAGGLTRNGHQVMLVWQLRGGSVGWTLLWLDDIVGYRIIGEASAAPRPGYRRGDKDMETIFCQL